MAIHKVLGTEAEYGIVVRGDIGFNPAVASSLVVNSYPGDRVKVQWSYEEESPGRDARGFGHDTFGVVDPEGAVVNSVLANGARLYVDHAHPEYSAPECYDPLEGALYDKVGEVVMQAAVRDEIRLPARDLAIDHPAHVHAGFPHEVAAQLDHDLRLGQLALDSSDMVL